jgi:hypothetical protein
MIFDPGAGEAERSSADLFFRSAAFPSGQGEGPQTLKNRFCATP